MSSRGWLKKDTNSFVVLGPFVASADGNTEQAALTINQADLILSKNGGAWASKAATGGATAQASGLYRIVIGSGDTDTAGLLDLYCHVSPALPVRYVYNVVPANVYDALVGGTEILYASAKCATATQVADKTGYTVAAGGIPVGGFAAGAINDASTAADMEAAIRDSVWAKQVEAQGTFTAQQVMSVCLAVLAGVTTASGATFKTPNGVSDRVTATLDATNQRTAMTLTPSA